MKTTASATQSGDKSSNEAVEHLVELYKEAQVLKV